MSTSDVLKNASELLDEKTKEYIIYNILKEASNSTESPIQSKKGRGGGYFLSEIEAESEDQVPSGMEHEAQTEYGRQKTLEKHIWPLFTEWLKSTKGLRNSSCDIANVKSGGVWGNPDVVGLKPIDKFGFFDVEVTSIEVKPSNDQWRYYFFEAVAHKRFAERAYFAFRSSESSAKGVEELLAYAEKFKVGVLDLEMKDEDYERLVDWDDMDYAERVELVDKVVELVPAPFESVALAEKIFLLERMGISDRKEIYEFGRSKD